jgi:V/A-type H+-transporting ATPase subunit E
MEMDLNSIISRIKQDGVQEAERKSQQILDQAKKDADRIIGKAEEEKESILKKAEDETRRMRNNAEESIKQAARDVLLGLRQSIIMLFDKIIKRKVGENMSSEVMKEMLIKLAENFKEDGDTHIEVLLNEKQKDELTELLISSLSEEMRKGVEIRPVSNIEHGFRVGTKEGGAYYDFTEEAVVEAMKNFLNEKVAELLSPGKSPDVE